MLKQLREQVLEANLEVVRRGLVLYTFGNVSGISRRDNLVVIKPSGVPYERMTADDLVVTDLEGRIVWGELNPSSDLATHLHLYKSFPTIGGVVHTHSEHAVAWAQACRSIPPLGTTHADYFYGPVPITRELTADEIKNDYVRATGVAITEAFGNRDPMEVPAALVVEPGLGALLCLHHPSPLLHLPQRAVERAGSETSLAGGAAPDLLHDGVAMHLLVAQGHHDVKHRRG